MKQLIIGLIITTIFLGCSGKSDAKAVKRTLAGTSWSAEKRAVGTDGFTWSYNAGIFFQTATECFISEVSIIVEKDMENSLMEYEGTYKWDGSAITITLPGYQWGDGEDKIWTLQFDGDKIKYNGTYGEFLLEEFKYDEDE